MFFHVAVAAEGEAGELCWERYASGPIVVRPLHEMIPQECLRS
jgi:hypothetical protein